jgi:carbonic anhydrase
MRSLSLSLLLLLAAVPAGAQSVCTVPDSAGREQSPVDIRRATAAPLRRLVTRYPRLRGRSFNTGHNVRVNVEPGGSITVDGMRFELQQFHFHWPSEHRFVGDSFPVEIHMVHEAADKRLAVVGTWVRVGAHNPAWDEIWARLPADTTDTVSVAVNIQRLFGFEDLNAERVYRYCGSLTSEPFGEGVTWLMRRTPITMSRRQIEQLRQAMHRYSRGVQPLNHRVIRYRRP